MRLGNLIRRAIVLDIVHENGIEHAVIRQRVAVLLVGTQLADGGFSIVFFGMIGPRSFT